MAFIYSSDIPKQTEVSEQPTLNFAPTEDPTAKLQADAQPEPDTQAEKKDGPSGTPEAKVETGAKADDPASVEVTDPFAPRFNEVVKPGTTPAAGGDGTTPAAGGDGKPPSTMDGKLPDVTTDPFAPPFTIVPKPGEPGKLPSTIDLNPFDPFKDWNTIPGIDQTGTTPGGKPAGPDDATVDPFDPFKDWGNVPELTPSVQPGAEKGPGEGTTPGAEVKPGGDKPPEVTPQPQPKRPPNPVFNETNVNEALKLAQQNNQPIIVLSTPNGQLDAAQQAAMQANASDAVFVNVNFANADRMMRAGLETGYYWQLANLCGAGGDVNNLYQKPGFMGRFNATDFNAQDPKGSLKAAAAGDLQAVFAGQVKPPVPTKDGEVPQGPSGPPAPGPQDGSRPDGTRPQDGPRPQVEPGKDVQPPTEQTDKPEDKKVKLEQVKFETADVLKAIQTAKDNNLPLLVYKGADFCHNCPPVSGAVDQFASSIKNAQQTDAVVLKINWETSQQLRRTNPELKPMLDQLQSVSSSVPHVSTYNPHDLSRPMGGQYGGSQSALRSMVNEARSAMNLGTMGGDGATGSPQARGAELPKGVSSEDSIQSAVELARTKNIPMLSYLESSSKPNPNMAKALQYLHDQGLASTAKIDRGRAERMMQVGLNSSHFDALKSSMYRTPDVAQDGSSHLSSFQPGNMKGNKFAPSKCTEAAKSPDEIINFMKASGVDLSKNNSEAAVRALLEGKPIPTAPEPRPEATPGQAKPGGDNQPQPEQKPAAQPEQQPVTPPEQTPPEQTPPEQTPPEQTPPKVLPELNPNPEVLPVQPEAKKEKPAQPEVPPTPQPETPPAQPQTPPAQPQTPPAQPETPPAQPETPKAKPEAPPEVTPPVVTPPQPETKKEPSLLDEVEQVTETKEKPKVEGEVIPASGENKVEKPKTKFKVNTAADAQAAIDVAKKENLPIVAHAMTVICTNDTCTPTNLDKSIPDALEGKAVFLELPRGGVSDIPAGPEGDALRAINDNFKVTDKDHKTELDIHIFQWDKAKGALQINDGGNKAKMWDTAMWLRNRLSKDDSER